MTRTSLDNLIINLYIHHMDLGEKVNNKLKYDLNCMCDDKRNFMIADAMLDIFDCYQLPCPDNDTTCITRLLNNQIASETCNTSTSGDTIIYTNVINNVPNVDITTNGISIGVYLSSAGVLQDGSYVTDIITGVTTSMLVLNKQTLLTAVTAKIRVDCTAITYTGKENCISATEMQDMLKILNDIFCTNYCADFEITIDE